MKRLFDIPFHQLEKFPNDKMFTTKKEGKWTSISTSFFIDLVNSISKGLIAKGIQPGDKIGIISSQ